MIRSLNPLATTFQPQWRCYRQYSSITSTESPSFCMTTSSASLTKLTSLLPQSHDCSCYVNRPILAPPPLWLQKHTDLRTLYFAHFPNLRHQPRLANATCPWSWRLVELMLLHYIAKGAGQRATRCKCQFHSVEWRSEYEAEVGQHTKSRIIDCKPTNVKWLFTMNNKG